MKLVIASDIHGAADYAARLMREVERIQPDKLVLLGDILYHGPRNDLPRDYAPKEVIRLLNDYAQNIICVRGNCEAEVDQMVLNFPCLSDSITIFDAKANKTLFFTHGHIWGPGLDNSVKRLPQLPASSFVFYGHTHIKRKVELDWAPGILAINPGSVGIPKDSSHSFALYDSGEVQHIEL